MNNTTSNYWLYFENEFLGSVEAQRDLTDHEVRMLLRADHIRTPPHSTDLREIYLREKKIIAADVRVAA